MTRSLGGHSVASLLAAAVVLLIYLLVLGVMPKEVFWSPDEGIKFITLQTVHWNHGLTYTLPYRGAAIDPEFKFYPSRCTPDVLYPAPEPDGTVQFHWPIWFPLLSSVFYATFGLTGLYVLPLVSAWLTAIASGVLVARDHRRLAPLVILLVGLATPVFFYGMCFWEHTLATLLGIVALVLMTSPLRGRKAITWSIATLLLIAVLLRVEMIAFAVATLVAWYASRRVFRAGTAHDTPAPRSGDRLRRQRWSYATIIGLAVILLWIAGRSLAPRHLELLSRIPEIIGGNLGKLRHVIHALELIFVSAPDPEGPPVSELWSWITFGAACVIVVAAFIRSRELEARLVLPALAIVLEYSLALVVTSRAYASRHGVLSVAPYMVVGIYAVPYAWHRRQYALTVPVAAAFLYLAFGFATLLSFWVHQDGTYRIGMDGGARYMMTLYPLGVILSAIAVQAYRQSDRHRIVKSAFTALVAAMWVVGGLYQLRGLEMMYHSRQQIERWQSALPTQGPILTDLWWLPAWMAPFFTQHEVYCVHEPNQVTDWLVAALAHGVDSFTFASFTPPDASQLTTLPAVDTETYHFAEGLHVTRFRLSGGSARRVAAE